MRAILLALVPLAAAPSAHAAFQLTVADAVPADPRAAHYSDVSLSLGFPGDSSPRDVVIDLPGGQLAALENAARCAAADAAADRCAANTMLGSAFVMVGSFIGPIQATGNIYLLPPIGTEVGRIAVVARPPVGDRITAYGTLRVRDDGTYGVRATVDGLPQQATISVPGSGRIAIPVTLDAMRLTLYGHVARDSAEGLFFNPAHCDQATFVISATAWNGSTAQDADGYLPTECDRVPFAPRLAFVPEHSAPSTPVDFGLRVTQAYDSTAPSVFATYRRGEITLPDGVSINAAVNSDGRLAACGNEEFAEERATPVRCPGGSQLGTVKIVTPVVTLDGRVYLAQPAAAHPDDLARLLFVAEQSEAVDALRVKFVARLRSDDETGRVSATIDRLPDVPASAFLFDFRGGDAAAARQPTECGTTRGSVNVDAVTGQPTARLEAVYTVDQQCDAAPAPASLALGSDTPTAGARAPLVASVRFRGGAPVRRLRMTLPVGLVGLLRDVPACGADDASRGVCPEASRIGSVVGLAGQSVTAGAFPGAVYLTTPPAEGALAGVLLQVPATVGPISIGRMSVHAALRLQPDLSVMVDGALPTSLRGLPLDLQGVDLRLDRPGFIRLPSRCATHTATVALDDGAQSREASGTFALGGCADLAWAPSLSVDLGPTAAQLVANARPTVGVVLRPGAGGAAARSLSLRLPPSIAIDLKALSRATCPDVASVTSSSCAAPAIGTATVTTPALAGAIQGEVRAARVAGQTLPAVIVHVRDRVSLDLVGRAAVASDGRLTITFDDLPDLPLDEVAIRLPGGANGVLQLGTSACGPDGARSDATLTAQHGARAELAVPVSRPCGTTLAARATTASLTLTRSARGRGAELRVTAPAPAPLRTATFRLPAGLTFAGVDRRRLLVRGPSGRIQPARITGTARTLTVVLRTPVQRMAIVTRAGTVRATPSIVRRLRTARGRASIVPTVQLQRTGATDERVRMTVRVRSR